MFIKHFKNGETRKGQDLLFWIHSGSRPPGYDKRYNISSITQTKTLTIPVTNLFRRGEIQANGFG